MKLFSGKSWQKERELQKIQFANPALNIAVFHDEGFKEYDLDVEIQQAVVGRYHDTEEMKFKKIEETTAATLTFKGQYSLLPDANEEIIRWITDNHYRLDGKRFNIYHVSPETEQSAEDMVTEVCFPVKPL